MKKKIIFIVVAIAIAIFLFIPINTKNDSVKKEKGFFYFMFNMKNYNVPEIPIESFSLADDAASVTLVIDKKDYNNSVCGLYFDFINPDISCESKYNGSLEIKILDQDDNLIEAYEINAYEIAYFDNSGKFLKTCFLWNKELKFESEQIKLCIEVKKADKQFLDKQIQFFFGPGDIKLTL